MIILKLANTSAPCKHCISIERTPYSAVKFSKWREAERLTEPLVETFEIRPDVSVRVLPVSKLPQVIAVLRLNGIEVEIGEGL